MGAIKSCCCLPKAGPKDEGRDDAEEPREQNEEGVFLLVQAAGLIVLLQVQCQTLLSSWEYVNY